MNRYILLLIAVGIFFCGCKKENRSTSPAPTRCDSQNRCLLGSVVPPKSDIDKLIDAAVSSNNCAEVDRVLSEIEKLPNVEYARRNRSFIIVGIKNGGSFGRPAPACSGKENPSAAPAPQKQSIVSVELQAAFDIYKKIIKAQMDYFEKNGTYATTFKQLNIEIPGGSVKPCITFLQEDDSQCIITDKYVFYINLDTRYKKDGVVVFQSGLKALDRPLIMFTGMSGRNSDNNIKCVADIANENICKALGGKMLQSRLGGSASKIYDIAL